MSEACGGVDGRIEGRHDAPGLRTGAVARRILAPPFIERAYARRNDIGIAARFSWRLEIRETRIN